MRELDHCSLLVTTLQSREASFSFDSRYGKKADNLFVFRSYGWEPGDHITMPITVMAKECGAILPALLPRFQDTFADLLNIYAIIAKVCPRLIRVPIMR